MEIRRHDIKLSSGTLPYAEFGEGRPLLYLHAAGGPQVSPFLEKLAATHRIYAPTAPGFEGTPAHDRTKSVRDLADLYGEFAEKVIKTPCDVMGHSFGGIGLAPCGGCGVKLSSAERSPTVVSDLLEAPSP